MIIFGLILTVYSLKEEPKSSRQVTDEAVAPRRPRKEAKQRGRPRGSKNKQKEVTTSSSALVNDETMEVKVVL